jgi:hypothetical protein
MIAGARCDRVNAVERQRGDHAMKRTLSLVGLAVVVLSAAALAASAPAYIAAVGLLAVCLMQN